MSKDTLKANNWCRTMYSSKLFYYYSRKTFSALVKPMSTDITDDEIDFLYVKLDTNGD